MREDDNGANEPESPLPFANAIRAAMHDVVEIIYTHIGTQCHQKR